MKGADMANGLRAKLSKLRHDGHITDVEYKSFIKKDGWHDAEIRAKAIDEFAERLEELFKYESAWGKTEYHQRLVIDISEIYRIAEEMRGAE